MAHFFYLITDKVVRFQYVRVFSIRYGGIAQLGEHLPCKQGVSGSIPLTSTKQFLELYAH